MTYKEHDDTVTLEMSREDYAQLLFMIGVAGGAICLDGDRSMFWTLMDLVNRMNAGNPRFRPYDIPEEFRRKQGDHL